MNRLLPFQDLSLGAPSFPYDFEFIPIHPLPLPKDKPTRKSEFSKRKNRDQHKKKAKQPFKK